MVLLTKYRAHKNTDDKITSDKKNRKYFSTENTVLQTYEYTP